MNKPELIKKLADRCCFRLQDVETMLDVLSDIIVETVENNDSISLHGIFTIYTAEWTREKYNDCIHGKTVINRKRNSIVKIKKGSRLKAIGKDNTQ